MEHPGLIRYAQQLDRWPSRWVLGVDEVGAGAWAGPLVVCGVVVDRYWMMRGLNDSKKLTRKKREAIFEPLQQEVPAWEIYFSPSKEVDVLHLGGALKRAYTSVVGALLGKYADALVVLDGVVSHVRVPHLCLPKADGLVPAVMAASVIAKVLRDREMGEYDGVYPGYDFKKSVGYGSAKHRAGLDKLGVSPIHRRSYAPIRKLLAAR